MINKIDLNDYKGAIIQYKCKDCQVFDEFFEDFHSKIARIKSGSCSHFNLKFIYNYDGGKFKYILSFNCNKCGQNNIFNLFDENTTDTYSYNEYKCEKCNEGSINIQLLLSKDKIKNDEENDDDDEEDNEEEEEKEINKSDDNDDNEENLNNFNLFNDTNLIKQQVVGANQFNYQNQINNNNIFNNNINNNSFMGNNNYKPNNNNNFNMMNNNMLNNNMFYNNMLNNNMINNNMLNNNMINNNMPYNNMMNNNMMNNNMMNNNMLNNNMFYNNMKNNNMPYNNNMMNNNMMNNNMFNNNIFNNNMNNNNIKINNNKINQNNDIKLQFKDAKGTLYEIYISSEKTFAEAVRMLLNTYKKIEKENISTFLSDGKRLQMQKTLKENCLENNSIILIILK